MLHNNKTHTTHLFLCTKSTPISSMRIITPVDPAIIASKGLDSSTLFVEVSLAVELEFNVIDNNLLTLVMLLLLFDVK